MPNLQSVTITNGVPTAGTGTVSTLDAVLAALAAKITVLLDASAAVALNAPAALDAPTIAALNVPRALDSATITALVAPQPATINTAHLAADGVQLLPKFKSVAVAATGTVVAAVAGKSIRVLALKLMASGAVNAKWQTSTGPADLTGLSYYTNVGDGEVLPFNPLGWFQTVAGDALNINLSGAVAVGGHLTYVEV